MNGNFNLQFEPNEYLRLSSTDDNSCYSWFFPQLNLNQAWEVKVRYRNISGYPLLIAASSSDGQYQMFENIFSDSNDWQTSYFVIPPYQTEQSGIQIQFNNNSYNYHPSTNDIASLEIYPANFSYPQPKEIPENEYLESKSNTWRYSVSLNDQMLNAKPASPPTSPNQGESQGGWKNSYLVLPQSYDKGWVAIYFDGWRPRVLKDHVLVNNWANAWNISSLATSHEHLTPIYLVFWPQVLQFLGFGLLIGTIIWLLTTNRLPAKIRS
jgi:hypothetical protein